MLYNGYSLSNQYPVVKKCLIYPPEMILHGKKIKFLKFTLDGCLTLYNVDQKLSTNKTETNKELTMQPNDLS